MISWLKENFEAVRTNLTTEIARYKNKAFMDAIVNACALIASADGSISGAEKQKMTGFIKNSPELKVFNMTDVIKSFNEACEKFQFDYHLGQAEALKMIGQIKGNEAQSRLLIRVACAIGASDGNFDKDEQTACIMICKDLGINPADFDL